MPLPVPPFLQKPGTRPVQKFPKARAQIHKRIEELTYPKYTESQKREIALELRLNDELRKEAQKYKEIWSKWENDREAQEKAERLRLLLGYAEWDEKMFGRSGRGK